MYALSQTLFDCLSTGRTRHRQQPSTSQREPNNKVKSTRTILCRGSLVWAKGSLPTSTQLAPECRTQEQLHKIPTILMDYHNPPAGWLVTSALSSNSRKKNPRKGMKRFLASWVNNCTPRKLWRSEKGRGRESSRSHLPFTQAGFGHPERGWETDLRFLSPSITHSWPDSKRGGWAYRREKERERERERERAYRILSLAIHSSLVRLKGGLGFHLLLNPATCYILQDTVPQRIPTAPTISFSITSQLVCAH